MRRKILLSPFFVYARGGWTPSRHLCKPRVINPLILVIEDDAPVYTTLKTHDYRYLTAKNGGEAIRMASSHNPNALILDLGLPDMYGIDVIRQVCL